MKFFVSCLWIALAIGFAAAFGSGGGGGDTSHNFTIYDDSGSCNSTTVIPTVSNPAGYTATSLTLTPGEKTLILLVIGDSISANSVPTAMTNGHPTKNQMINIYSGLGYQYKDPVIGAQQANPGSYPGLINDLLITSTKFARVITFDVAVGGHCSYDFSPTGNKGHRVRVACLYLRQLGYPVSGSGDSGNWRFGVIYAHGTNDVAKGSSPAVFSAAALATFQGLRDYGCTPDIFVSKITMNSNVVNAAMQAAQAGLVDNPNKIYVGADYDSLTGSNRIADGTHLSDVGAANVASLWSTLIQAHY